MGEVKQANIKNRTYYFYNDIINLKDFEPNLLKIGKSHTKTLIFTTLETSRLKKMMIIENIYSVNHASGYIEEKNGNEYLNFDSVDENKEVLKNTQMFGMELNMRLKQ